MILVREDDKDKDALLMCKTGSDEFHIEIGYPLNPFLAFGIVLTSFDFKLLCQ